MTDPLVNFCEAGSSTTPANVLSARSLELIATKTLIDAIALSEKADRLLTEWQQRHRPTEPVLANLENCVELFLQSQQIRFSSDLFEEPDEHYYPDQRKSATRDTIVAKIAPDQLADAIAQLPEAQALEATLSLAHAEDIDAWIDVVRSIATTRITLSTLVQRSGLSIVQVWIALLFGGFTIEREGDFYDGMIFVGKIMSDS